MCLWGLLGRTTVELSLCSEYSLWVGLCVESPEGLGIF
jgi:hypothetical protein